MTNKAVTPFKSIRQMAADVVLNSTELLVIHSNLVGNELKNTLEEFRGMRKESPLSVPTISAENELGLCLFFNAVNFCYRDPASGRSYIYQTRDGRQLRRTSAFFAALVETGLEWDHVDQAAALTSEHWREMMQLKEPNVLYLGMERCDRIIGMAKYLQMHGYRAVTEFVTACGYNVNNLVKPLVDCGYFRDEFFKRAQVGLKMMDAVLSSRMGRSLAGVDHLTCMADYRIPQVFYNLGVVELSPRLRAHLEAEKPVISESREEIALRATVIVVGKQLAELMSINEAEVDTLLWEYSQLMDKEGRMKIPHMLVATDKY